MENYETRLEKFGLTSKGDIKTILATHNDNITFLDVRNEQEVAVQPFFDLPKSSDRVLLHHIPCTRDDATLLESKVDEILPDKNAHVIVFCRSGARAGKSTSVLKDLGYANVYNAGGVGDMDYIVE